MGYGSGFTSLLNRRLAGVFVALFVGTFLGCATNDEPPPREEPDLRFTGNIAPGEIQGERASQVLGALETRMLQAFPRAGWLTGKSVGSADVLLDLNVYSAKTQDTRSNQESRTCRRWSEPDKDAKSTLQKLASRNCLDWQVQSTPCLTRRYDLDVQIRARQPGPGRIISSERKVISSSMRECGDRPPSSVALQAKAEDEVARWVVTALRVPLLAATVASPPPTNPPAVPAVNLPIPGSEPLASVSPTIAATRTELSVEAHALVIGNSNYPGAARLANPINDARAIASTLSALGFQVTRVDDGNREALVKALSQFQQKAAQSQITILFYSGHGMQIDGVNYLLPVDVDAGRPASLKLQGLPLDMIVDTYLPGRTRIVFLDACRDNPSVATTVRGIGRGLAPMNVPSGTLIAYATRDGGTAEDGRGKHSPFTQALLDLIVEPEDISLILRKVRDRVMRETGGRQQPWEYGSLSGGTLVLSRLNQR